MEGVGQPAIAIHGGAGDLGKYRGTARIPDAEEFLARVIDESYAKALDGLAAIDIVTQAVVSLEDSGIFLAGKGSTANEHGIVELDASIMDGSNLMCGAVIAVSSVQNPIVAARHVMTDTKHVILSGNDADAFAERCGLQPIPQSYFVPCTSILQNHGTVGAVARDVNGNMAAATSTGGVTGKMAGRVGDSPIIGAGTYAQNGIGAISCTGVGEFFIRVAAASQVIARMDLIGESVGAATGYILHRITDLGGGGGMIAIGPRGEIAMPFSTEGMYRASIDAWGKRTIGIF